MIPPLEPEVVSFISILSGFIAAGCFSLGAATVWGISFLDSKGWEQAYFDIVNESERRLSDALAREHELRKKLVDTLPRVGTKKKATKKSFR